LIAVPLYMRQSRVGLPAGVIAGGRRCVGCLAGSTPSHSWLSYMQKFKPVFAVLVLIGLRYTGLV
jgi:hypothetical protein